MPPNSLRRTTQTLEMLGPMGITLYSHFPIGLDEYTQQQPVPTRTNISSRGKCPIQSKGLPLITYQVFLYFPADFLVFRLLQTTHIWNHPQADVAVG